MFGGIRIPVSWFLIISGIPPTGVAITGVSQAMASFGYSLLGRFIY